MAPTPGLLLSLCRTNPTASLPTTLPILQHWYETVHIPDVFTAASSPSSSPTPRPAGPSLALRYKNKSPTAQWPLLVLYQLPDVELLRSGALQNVPIKWDGWQGPGGKRRSVAQVAEFEVRAYERIQVFEGQVPRKGERAPLLARPSQAATVCLCCICLVSTMERNKSAETMPNSGRGKCIITVAMEPAPGSDEDFDEWYRKQVFFVPYPYPYHYPGPFPQSPSYPPASPRNPKGQLTTTTPPASRHAKHDPHLPPLHALPPHLHPRLHLLLDQHPHPTVPRDPRIRDRRRAGRADQAGGGERVEQAGDWRGDGV